MSKYIDGIIGHAIGDAMGVPPEFCIREKLQRNKITNMIGHGSHDVPAGTWSDDTAMEIALSFKLSSSKLNCLTGALITMFAFLLPTPSLKVKKSLSVISLLHILLLPVLILLTIEFKSKKLSLNIFSCSFIAF